MTNKKLRVFIITCVFPPEPVMSAVTSADLAQEMTNRGHEVLVFSPFPNRPTGSIIDGYKRKWKQEKKQNRYKIIYSWHTLSKNSTFLSRAFENLSFGLTSTYRIWRNTPPDVVYLNTWPIFARGLNTWLLKKIGVPIICSVQDIYPESLTGKGLLCAFF